MNRQKCTNCKSELSWVCYRNKGEHNQTRIGNYYYCVKCDKMYKMSVKEISVK